MKQRLSRTARMTATLEEMPDSTQLTPADLAQLGIAELNTLTNWRAQRRGPRYIVVGSGIRYLLGDLRAWLRAGGSRGTLHKHPSAAA